LVSLNSYAKEGRELLIENITYPDKEMNLKCLKMDCSLITKNDNKVSEMKTVMRTAMNRRGRRNIEEQQSLTKESSDNRGICC